MKREFDKPTEEELSYIYQSHKKYQAVVVILMDHDISLWSKVIKEVKRKPKHIETFTVNGYLIVPFEIIGNRMIAIKKEV